MSIIPYNENGPAPLLCPQSSFTTGALVIIPTCTSLASPSNGTIDITVQVSGLGDYEFAIDTIDGPYQDNAEFQNLEPGFHTFYVKDKNGCGIAEKSLKQDLTLNGFPKFFTPNGDGINDFWQYVPPLETGEINIESIWVYDRYGNLIAQLDSKSRGWSGNFKGKSLPASDYWFKAVTFNRRKIHGHFTLKR